MADPEDFLFQQSEVANLMKLLNDIMENNKLEGTKEKQEKKPEADITANVTENSFLVMRRTPKGKKSYAASKSVTRRTHKDVNVNEMSFMRQVDATRKQQIQAQQERLRVAENFRRLGNEEFRRHNYDKSIILYSKGLQYIKDTPVLYCNRALALIKKREFKLALLDLDYVVNKLQPSCLRAWLYRASAMKRMHNEKDLELAIRMARKYQRTEKDIQYVDMFLEKLRSDF